MKQSRLSSLTEVVVSTIAGFFISLVAQWILFPLYDIHTTYSQDIQLVMWFTAISIVRSYVFRRFFNSNYLAIAIQAYQLERFKRQREREMQCPALSTDPGCGCGCGAPMPGHHSDVAHTR